MDVSLIAHIGRTIGSCYAVCSSFTSSVPLEYRMYFLPLMTAIMTGVFLPSEVLLPPKIWDISDEVNFSISNSYLKLWDSYSVSFEANVRIISSTNLSNLTKLLNLTELMALRIRYGSKRFPWSVSPFGVGLYLVPA